jgi:ankyrin repeat protein
MSNSLGFERLNDTSSIHRDENNHSDDELPELLDQQQQQDQQGSNLHLPLQTVDINDNNNNSNSAANSKSLFNDSEETKEPTNGAAAAPVPQFSEEQLNSMLTSLPSKMRDDIAKQLSNPAIPAQMKTELKANMIMQANQWKSNPGPALIFAVKKHNMSLVKMLVEEFSADINTADEDGNTCLHWSTWYKNSKITEYLIDKSAEIERCNPKQQYPIHWACMGGDIGCIRLLVNAGSKLDNADKDGYKPVHCAAQHGHTAALDYLKLRGVDLKALDYNHRSTLHWSAFKNELITTQFLLGQGVDQLLTDTGGRSALHWACSQNNLDILMYLINEAEAIGEANKLLNMKDNEGLTPLQVAEKKESKRCARFIQNYLSRKQKFWYQLFLKLFCLDNKGGKIYDKKGNTGVKIAAWIHVLLFFTLLHYTIAIMPDSATGGEIAYSTHVWMILTIVAAVVMWWVTYLKDPGYLIKNSSNTAIVTSSTAEAEEKAVLVDMDALGRLELPTFNSIQF